MKAPSAFYVFLLAAVLSVAAMVDHGLRSREIQELQAVEAGSSSQLSSDIAANQDGQFFDDIGGVLAAAFGIGALGLLYKERERLTAE